ncbi:MAG: hypothetical protein PHX21_12920 [bacterium]|nr:hypothetical protein [bacterium]
MLRQNGRKVESSVDTSVEVRAVGRGVGEINPSPFVKAPGLNNYSEILTKYNYGMPHTMILRDGVKEMVAENFLVVGMGITRPKAMTTFHLEMGEQLRFFNSILADLIDGYTNTGAWSGFLAPDYPVAYQFKDPMILTKGTELKYLTEFGTNPQTGTDPKMDLWLRGFVIPDCKAKRSQLVYMKSFDLNSNNYTLINFGSRDVYILSMTFYDMNVTTGPSEYFLVQPNNVADYNALAAYQFEGYLKRNPHDEQQEKKWNFSNGKDRWGNYSIPFMHKEIKFQNPVLLHENECFLIKLNPSEELGVFTPQSGTWTPRVQIEYKLAPGQVGTYV